MTLVADGTIQNKTRMPLYAKAGWPILGLLPQLSRNPAGFLEQLLARHGSVVPIKIGPYRVVVAGHPEAVRRVCVLNAENYEKTRFVEKLKPVLGNGLATSNGHAWEQSRRVIQPALTHVELRRMIGTMDGVIRGSVEAWPTKTFDIAHASCSLTMKVLSATMFDTMDEGTARRMVTAVEDIQHYISLNIWSIFEWRKHLAAPSYRRFTRAMDAIWSLVRELIAMRRGGERRDDLLQALVDAVDTKTGQPFDIQQILDEVMTVFMAGHDTTGNTLAFVWNALASDSELQTKIRAEVMACVPLDRTPTFEELSQMKLTTSLLKEILRLYPSAWWFSRTAKVADELMGVPVRAGDTVMIAPYVTHRLPEVWDDPLRFDPYRFLNAKPMDRFGYLPFGAGPRICPGSHFATTEMLLTIARVLQHRELHKECDIQCEALVTLRPKGGLPMKAKPWAGPVTVSGVRPGQHAAVDAMFRLRKRVFADKLGWKLEIDSEGREIDQFDDEDSEYTVMVSGGRIMTYGRLRSTDRPSLLFDVYSNLFDAGKPVIRDDKVWECTRLGASPDITSGERNRWMARIITDGMKRKRDAGAHCFCSVSDPAMEKLLRRLGLDVHRLGDTKIDVNGVQVLGLRIDLGARIRE